MWHHVKSHVIHSGVFQKGAKERLPTPVGVGGKWGGTQRNRTQHPHNASLLSRGFGAKRTWSWEARLTGIELSALVNRGYQMRKVALRPDYESPGVKRRSGSRTFRCTSVTVGVKYRQTHLPCPHSLVVSSVRKNIRLRCEHERDLFFPLPLLSCPSIFLSRASLPAFGVFPSHLLRQHLFLFPETQRKSEKKKANVGRITVCARLWSACN